MSLPQTSSPTVSATLSARHWSHSHGEWHRGLLLRKAGALAARHIPPVTLPEWKQEEARLRESLCRRLHLGGELSEAVALDLQEHGRIACPGYTIRKISFFASPGNRMTALLYVPESADGADMGKPLPAVLNVHGHHRQGKLAAAVQARGHLLALNGFVVLSVDAAGAGERGSTEHEWRYHGAHHGAEMFLYGDTLLGQQVRDNRRAIDLLQSLPFVDAGRIGVTGASGGGNQTMWIAALDERVKAAVPVVSVGSFEVYVTQRNCICETLPGFLAEAEEWQILGLIAPRALLVLTALHDAPAFGYEPMSQTTRTAEEVYRLYGAREKFDRRILNTIHGYFTEAQECMVGWMKHWLAGEPRSTPEALPFWEPIPEEELVCFPKGERPDACDYTQFRRARLSIATGTGGKGTRDDLSRLIGWTGADPAILSGERPSPNLDEAGVQFQYRSSRGIPVPVNRHGPLSAEASTIHLLLSPEGKGSAFVRKQAQAIGMESGAECGTLLALDLPGTGELAWEDPNLVEGARWHDLARASLWLGETIAAEWAEAVQALLKTVRRIAPKASITLHAEAEAAFAALLGQAIDPVAGVVIREYGAPRHLLSDIEAPSLVWHIPGFLAWGDLDDLRALAGNHEMNG